MQQGIDVDVDVVQQGIGRNWSNLGSAHSKSASGASCPSTSCHELILLAFTSEPCSNLSGVRREFVKIGQIVGVT